MKPPVRLRNVAIVIESIRSTRPVGQTVEAIGDDCGHQGRLGRKVTVQRAGADTGSFRDRIEWHVHASACERLPSRSQDPSPVVPRVRAKGRPFILALLVRGGRRTT
ncbi:hypothetical protein BSP109_02150 [Brevibacterium sp. Mu109]|nr:hypothetical protein BSP109_02150 [Brevibacterium sp. Mu109]